jgi:hypothetical protein
MMIRITEQEFTAFVLGAIVGSIITWWNATRERRIVFEIRATVDRFGLLQGRPVSDSSRINTDELLEYHKWALAMRARDKKYLDRKTNDIALAAEAILCEKCFGLSRIDALQIIHKAKDRDLNELLQAQQRSPYKGPHWTFMA